MIMLVPGLLIVSYVLRPILSLARLPISPPWLKFARPGTNSTEPSTDRQSLRELTQSFFAHEMKWQFAIEALLFAIIAAISACPIFAAADSLTTFVRGLGT